MTQQMLCCLDCPGPSQWESIIPTNGTRPKTYADVIWVSMHTELGIANLSNACGHSNKLPVLAHSIW